MVDPRPARAAVVRLDEKLVALRSLVVEADAGEQRAGDVVDAEALALVRLHVEAVADGLGDPSERLRVGGEAAPRGVVDGADGVVGLGVLSDLEDERLGVRVEGGGQVAGGRGELDAHVERECGVPVAHVRLEGVRVRVVERDRVAVVLRARVDLAATASQ